MLLDFDFSEMKKTRLQRYVTNDIYENVHKLDLN